MTGMGALATLAVTLNERPLPGSCNQPLNDRKGRKSDIGLMSAMGRRRA